MSQLEAYALEGRLNGLREVLQDLLVHLARKEGLDLRESLAEKLVPSDPQEDPGAVPDPSLAVDAAATREIRLILEHVALKLQEADDAAAGQTASLPQQDHR